MRVIDSHVHIGNNPKWAPETISRYVKIGLTWRIPKTYIYYPIEYLENDLTEAEAQGAVVFAFPEDIYRVEDSVEIRMRANEYVLKASKTGNSIYPFYFVWNDYLTPESLGEYAGIKWHRHYDEPNYYYDDSKCLEILEKIEELKMPVLIEDEYNETVNFVKNNPKLNIIIPHCGKRMWIPPTLDRLLENFERMRFFFEKPNVFFDTGGVEPGIPLDVIKKTMDIVGPERLIMGSDTPYNTPKLELEKLLKLDLSEDEMELILSKNIESLISRWLKERSD
jgi:hypothetical protein